ncbi:MAG TPA: SRPBCC domain-containing protein [Gammaproteobacteria bacterium]|nr:SRPBCC domain-containing protein [Gammaproteobacteria bacterium]
MNKQDMSFSFTVEQSPEQVFAAVADVRGWWPGKFTGDTDRLGAEFSYRYQDMHRSTQKVTEWVPGKRVVWHVTESWLSFLEQKDEWTGTDIVFDIAREGGKTELSFTHVGLSRKSECYEACSEGWGFCIEKSLYQLITTGKGMLDFEAAA